MTAVLDVPDIDFLRELIQAEYCEMPGLHLTKAQVQRLWGLDEESCRRVIDVLVGSSFLRWTAPGTIARAGD